MRLLNVRITRTTDAEGGKKRQISENEPDPAGVLYECMLYIYYTMYTLAPVSD